MSNLETIHKKLNNGDFFCTQDFLNDIDLMVENVVDYYDYDNHKTSKLYCQRAKLLQDFAYALVNCENSVQESKMSYSTSAKPKISLIQKLRLKELLYSSWRLGLMIGSKKRISRSKAMESVLAYIRTHKLQDPDNKMFTPDNILAPIFGKEKIREFSMAKYLKGHLTVKKPLDRYIY